MHYEEALEASKHNPEEVNKVLERLEVECPDCLAGLPGFEPQRCNTCNGTHKIKWKRQPQVGEWIIYKGKISLIHYEWIDRLGNMFDEVFKECIPILDWETIEGILEKAGYGITMILSPHRHGFVALSITDETDNEIISFRRGGKSRQEAVMKAIIELGKEMK